jgi:hypothetical protein
VIDKPLLVGSDIYRTSSYGRRDPLAIPCVSGALDMIRGMSWLPTMESVGRARERGETLGFMKMAVDADSERMLGAAMLGIEVDEIVQAILDLMYAGQSYTLIGRAMYIHPTVSECLPTSVGNPQPLV